MKNIFVLSAALIALNGFSVPAAQAQEEPVLPESQTYDPQFQGWVNPAEQQMRDAQRATMGDKGFIAPTEVQVSIVHPSYMEEDQFGIQMSVPDVVSGCFSLTPLEYEAKYREPRYLDIKVKKYRRIEPEGADAARKCDIQNKMSTALMVFSKKDLMERKTDEIHFSTESAKDVYKITVDNDRVELVPQTMSLFKAQNMTGPLKDRIVYAFESSRIVALQVPMAQDGEDLSREVTLLAGSRALSPAKSMQMETGTGNGTATYYFYDNSGSVIDQIGPDGYSELGQISVNRPYDGPDGRTKTAVPLRVFVTRPGTQL